MGHNCAVDLYGLLQIKHGFRQNVIHVNRGVLVVPAIGGLPILAHAFEQGIHPLGTFNRIGDELIGILVEFAFVFFGKKLGIGGYHAERFLQVVRRSVGKVLEVI